MRLMLPLLLCAPQQGPDAAQGPCWDIHILGASGMCQGCTRAHTHAHTHAYTHTDRVTRNLKYVAM